MSMPPTKDDLPIVGELEFEAARLEERSLPWGDDLAILLRRAAQELHEYDYRVWELEMGEDL